MIGAIADDFTGATDIAVAFRRAGLRVAIVFEAAPAVSAPEADVVVVGLKTRTVPAAKAVECSLTALAWLRDQGAGQIMFKYCSTFDSRADGNIGPVADALADALAAPRAVFVPASPEHLRTQYMGTLFVDRARLDESPLRDHPLTPMRDASVPRLLQPQTRRAVALIDHRDVREGRDHIAVCLDEASATSPFLVVDALSSSDLVEIGAAVSEDTLVTGAAGLAAGLATAAARRLGRTPGTVGGSASLGDVPEAVLAGSCSARTLEQITRMQEAGHPSLQLDAVAVPDAERLATDALAWYDALPATARASCGAPLIASSLPPDELRRTQEILGVDGASAILETATGLIARGLVERGVRRLVIAGGETSGAVVSALGISTGLVGPEVAAGVPWIRTALPDDPENGLDVLLKSGNFGGPDMFLQALRGETR